MELTPEEQKVHDALLGAGMPQAKILERFRPYLAQLHKRGYHSVVDFQEATRDGLLQAGLEEEALVDAVIIRKSGQSQVLSLLEEHSELLKDLKSTCDDGMVLFKAEAAVGQAERSEKELAALPDISASGRKKMYDISVELCNTSAMLPGRGPAEYSSVRRCCAGFWQLTWVTSACHAFFAPSRWRLIGIVWVAVAAAVLITVAMLVDQHVNGKEPAQILSMIGLAVLAGIILILNAVCDNLKDDYKVLHTWAKSLKSHCAELEKYVAVLDDVVKMGPPFTDVTQAVCVKFRRQLQDAQEARDRVVAADEAALAFYGYHPL